jgi:hypothetical protein
MQEPDKIQLFFKLLTESGLPEGRIIFWLNRFKSGRFSEDDSRTLTHELMDHLDNIDKAEKALEEDREEAKKKLAKLEADMLPYLQKLAAEQPKANDDQIKEYKDTILAAEKEMTSGIEKIRTSKQTAEMEAIRKKLLLN